MRITELRKAIKAEQRDPEGLTAYIAWMQPWSRDGRAPEHLTSNFLSDADAKSITIKQLEKMEAEGLLERDYLDWLVKK